MKRVVQALAGLAVGLGLGLLYAWVISPVQYVDTAPNTLRSDYQAAYVLLAARAYRVDGDLGRARTRLALLELKNPAESVAAQAERVTAAGDTDGGQALSLLAVALAGGPAVTPAPTSTPGPTPTPAPSDTPTPTRTPQPTDTVVPSITPQLLPTHTPTPTQLAAFVFVGQQAVCDPDLGQPLIQVITEDANGEQIPGVEVDVTWQDGFDHFFTGLKPDLGAGYGDFTMTNGTVYSVNLAQSPGVTIDNLSPATCTGASGSSYPGSILLIFRQPR